MIEPYYGDDDCILYNGKSEEVLPCIEDKSIDLTITSPPYDNLRAYNGYSWDFEMIAKELYRVTKPGGVCVWVVGDQTIDGSETLTSAKQKIFFREGCGWNIHDTMIYHKTGLTFPETNRYYPAFEYMYVLSRGKPKTTNLIADVKNKYAGGIIQGHSRQVSGDLKRRSGHGRLIKEFGVRQNVWSYGTGWMVTSNDKEAFEHGAAFAEAMACDHVKSWSNLDETVLDCFAGSGTTLKAAKLLKRKGVGIEISEKYCDLIKRRLNPPIPLFEPTTNVYP